MTKKRICENCTHFAEDTTFKHHECRESSPVVLIMDEVITGAWPKVAKDDWCSRYSDREYMEKLRANLGEE